MLVIYLKLACPWFPLACGFILTSQCISHIYSLTLPLIFLHFFIFFLPVQVPGDVRVETMTTDYATLTFEGFGMHTSFAKGTTGHGRLYDRKLRSALVAASMLVADISATGWTAEQTQDREPFFHVTQFDGDVEDAKVGLWMRSFEAEGACFVCLSAISIRSCRCSAPIWCVHLYFYEGDLF